jgi:hypothetical protein
MHVLSLITTELRGTSSTKEDVILVREHARICGKSLNFPARSGLALRWLEGRVNVACSSFRFIDYLFKWIECVNSTAIQLESINLNRWHEILSTNPNLNVYVC